MDEEDKGSGRGEPVREIRFRAWDKKEKKMIATVGIPAGDYREEPHRYTGQEIYIRPDSPHYVLMQFTGLLDKNGREIYEGDIVEWSPPEGSRYFVSDGDPEPLKRIVVWLVEEGSFGWRHLNGDTDQSGYSFTKANFESMGSVIGNIHENPELLKEGTA